MLAVATVASAQSGGPYALKKSTFDSGGAAEGGAYRLTSTAGQSGAAELSGGAFSMLGGFWSPSSAVPFPPLAPLIDSIGSHSAKNRYISLVLPQGGSGQDTAIRVRLASIHHPAGPPNAPNLSAFEGQYRYLNSVRDVNNNPVFSCPDSAASTTFYNCAVLGCTPEYRDWAMHFGGLPIHVTASAVVPSSQYAISQLAASCAGNEASCAAASTEYMVGTERWGNVDGVPANGAPSATDIGRVVDKVRELPGAFIEARCLLQGAAPNPNGAPVNAQDLARIVDAVKGAPYPFTISACP